MARDNDPPSTIDFDSFQALGALGDFARASLDEFTDLEDDQIAQIVDAGEAFGRAVLPPDQPAPTPDRGTPGGAAPSSPPLGVSPGLLLVGGVVVLLLVLK